MRQKARATKTKKPVEVNVSGNPGPRARPSRRAAGPPEHRNRYPRVPSLAQHMRAFGTGSEGRKGRAEFADRCGTSLPYLTHLALGFRQASASTAIQIEKASHGLVRVEDLIPTIDWNYLARRNHAPSMRLKRVSA